MNKQTGEAILLVLSIVAILGMSGMAYKATVEEPVEKTNDLHD